MPGYIHTCGNCGTHMQVHERYLGRTLKCTSCRTEFEAILPAGAVTDEPALPEPEGAPSKPSAARFLPWLVLYAASFGYVAGVSLVQSRQRLRWLATQPRSAPRKEECTPAGG